LTDSKRADLGIVIALTEEFREFYPSVKEQSEAVYDPDALVMYYTFSWPVAGARAPYRCVAALIGDMGPADAQRITDRLISRFDPATLVMLGIAAGLHDDLALGDVVVAEQVDSYLQAGKVRDAENGSDLAVEFSGKVRRCDEDLTARAKQFEFTHSPAYESWQVRCSADTLGLLSESVRGDLVARSLLRPAPVMQVVYVAAGPVVAAGSNIVRMIRGRDRRLKALDMESGGLMEAALARGEGRRTFVLRGISDFGDERKHQLDRTGGGAIRRIAMRNATALLWELLDAEFFPRASRGGGAPRGPQPIVPWRDLPPRGAPDLFRLLDWRTRLTPLIGREDGLQSLLDWAYDGGGVLVRFLVGPGGAGKSRLALEAADALRGAEWMAGQVFLDRLDGLPVPDGDGVFWVIDYPESARPQVRDLLRGLARMQAVEAPVRVLLLSRVPMKEWHSVIDAAGAASICDSQEVQIGALAVEGAAELFASAARRLADYVGKPVPAVGGAEVAAWLEKDPEIHCLPLFVVAAALHAVLAHPAELSLSGAKIVEALVRRERMRLDNAGANAGWGEKAASRLVGLATVSGGLDPAAVRRLAADPEVGLPAERTVDAVKALGWWEGSRLHAPTPDIVAAELLFSILDDAPDRAPEWLWAALADVAPREVDRLGRVAYDVGTLRGAGDHNRFAAWLAAAVDGQPERAARWEPIADERRLPLGVLPLAVAICIVLLDDPSADEAHRAALLVSLSNCLNETGDLSRAAEAAGEAVQIYLRVAEHDRARFEPLLAGSLTTLSASLGDHDPAAALEASRNAVEIWRRLAAADPAAYEPELARALRSLSVSLGEGPEKDPKAGLAAMRESVAIWRRLAKASPRYEADLAQALNTLCVDLSETGDEEGSLRSVSESVEIWRRLARANPARHEPGLALALNNLSRSLSAADDHEGAAHMLREAIRIYGRAAAAHPARYEPDLVRSLENLSSDLSRVGNPDAAVSAQREAIAIRRRLLTTKSRRYRPGWADEMGLLARGEEALEDGLLSALLTATKTVLILLVRGESPDGESIYAYVAVRADRLESFMEAQKHGIFYPEDFGVIVEAGQGDPSPEVKARMSEEYGFNHDAMLDIPDVETAHDITRQLGSQPHDGSEVADGEPESDRDEEPEPGE